MDREGDGRRPGRESTGASFLCCFALALLSFPRRPTWRAKKGRRRQSRSSQGKLKTQPRPALSCAVSSHFLSFRSLDLTASHPNRSRRDEEEEGRNRKGATKEEGPRSRFCRRWKKVHFPFPLLPCVSLRQRRGSGSGDERRSLFVVFDWLEKRAIRERGAMSKRGGERELARFEREFSQSRRLFAPFFLFASHEGKRHERVWEREERVAKTKDEQCVPGSRRRGGPEPSGGAAAAAPSAASPAPRQQR